MPNYPESGIKLVIETGDAESTVSELMSQLDDLQGQTYTASFEVEADASQAEEALADLPLEGGNVDFTIDVEQTGDDLSDLPVDGETIETPVDIKPTQTTTTFLDKIQTWAVNKTLDLVWNITGSAVEFLASLPEKAITPILDLGDAVAEVGAKTGGAIPNASELINKIFYSDIGRSKEEVGKMIIAANGLKLPIEEAVTAAGTFTHTWSDVDSIQAINTFGTLLKTNLVGSMQEASDLMTVFFQNSGDKAGDALQVVEANAESWANMGLTGKEALSTITTLLEGNVDSASNAAKMIQTLDDALTNAAADASSPQAKLLRQMGLENPKDDGKAMGADFIDGFAEAFTTLPADQQDLASGLLFGKGGKKFTGALEGMSAKSDIFKNITDAAELAAKEIDNSLRGAIDDFVLEANKKMQEFLSSKAIDLPGKIDKLRNGLQSGMDALAKGGTLSEALTVALKPIGFDDEFQVLEKILGNFVIAILQAVSFLQSLDPANWAAKAGTDALIAKQGATQLAFDLKIANPDDVAMDIATATSRGLSQSKITDVVSGVITQLIKDGTQDSLAQAQLLVDTLKAPIDQNKLPTLASGAPMNVEPTVTDTAIIALQEQINTALKEAPPPDIIDELSANMGLLDTGVKKVTTSAGKVYGPVQESAGALDMVTGAAPPATDALFGVGGALDAITSKATAFNTAVGSATDAANAAVTTAANTSGGGNSAPSQTQSSESLMSALMPFVPGGTVSGGGGSSFNLSSVNIVPNIATADALGYRQAAILRGAAQK